MKLNELIILEAGKDPMSVKPKGDELEALAHFLAICNLGHDANNKAKDGEFVLNRKDYLATNFKGVIGAVKTQLHSLAESDEMMDDFEDEIKMWRKDLAKQTRAQIAAAQKDLAAVFTIIANTGTV